jgi:hypothetical protein
MKHRIAALLGMALVLSACEGKVGPTGPQGEPGPAGAAGPQGLPGPAGTSGLANRQDFTGTVGANGTALAALPIASAANGRLPAISCYESSGTPGTSGQIAWFAVNQSVFGTSEGNSLCAILVNPQTGVPSVALSGSIPGWRYYFVVAW